MENQKKIAIICGRGSPHLPPQPPENPPLKRIIREKYAEPFTAKLRKQIAREIVWKNELDNLFWTDPHQHWGEVFYLEWKENGPILHLDFNSMYPTQLCTLPFHHPKTLRCLKGNWTKEIENQKIRHGLFLSTLTQKTHPDRTWFSQHHYLRYAQNKRSHHFLWPKHAEVHTLLHAQDIALLSQFAHIQTHWGIFNPENQVISHPLKPLIQTLLEKKTKASSPEEKTKAKLLLVQACSHQSQIHRQKEKNQENAERLLGEIPMFSEYWKGPRNSSAHSLFTPLKAGARTQLLQLAHFLHQKKARLLRCHTDGLSVGCLSHAHAQEILHSLQNHPLHQLGPNPGQLKASHAQEGFFLGPAIWWTNTKSQSERKIAEYAGADPKNPFLTETTYQYHGETKTNNTLFLEETSKILRTNPQGLKIWLRTPPQNPTASRNRRKRSRKKRFQKYIQYQSQLKEEEKS